MKINKFGFILLYIGVIICSLVFITSTYAYITIELANEEKPIVISTFDKNMEISYIDTSNVSLVNGYTGQEINKTFTVKNTGDSIVYYDIMLENVVNNFENKNDLVYTLIGDNDLVVKEHIIPSMDTHIASNIMIDINETHTYNLNIKFIKTIEDQSNNMNKTFSSNINIVSSSINIGTNIYKSEDYLGYKIISQVIGNELSDSFKNQINGVYKTNSSINGSTTYFYRGDKKLNNNIIIGDYCFRIIRTTETNGIRVIYNGIKNEDGSCNSKTPYLEEKNVFNDKDNFNAYVGYMYGIVSSNSYINEHSNSNSSDIKIALDTWYVNHLKEYANLLDKESIYCNNRNTNEFLYKGTLYGTHGYSNYNTGYELTNSYYLNNKDVSYECINENDRLTINNSLDNPVGLISVNELYYAGYDVNIKNDKKKNINNYLYTNNNYWTMTPAYFNGSSAYNFVVASNRVIPDKVSNLNYIRPAITLKYDTIVSEGDGSNLTPYIIKSEVK